MYGCVRLCGPMYGSEGLFMWARRYAWIFATMYGSVWRSVWLCRVV